jgi:hypothetical protein
VAGWRMHATGSVHTALPVVGTGEKQAAQSPAGMGHTAAVPVMLQGQVHAAQLPKQPDLGHRHSRFFPESNRLLHQVSISRLILGASASTESSS